MQLGTAFSQEIFGPLPIDQAFAAAGELASRYGCEIVVKLAEGTRWNPAWGSSPHDRNHRRFADRDRIAQVTTLRHGSTTIHRTVTSRCTCSRHSSGRITRTADGARNRPPRPRARHPFFKSSVRKATRAAPEEVDNG
jgi:hypothetical protein